MAPDLAGSKHGVNGACELARGGDAGDAPVDALLEFGVVLREPTVGRVADVDHGGLHERVAEPAVGAGGDGAIVDGHPRAGRARSEAGVAHQVLGSPESLDGHRLRGDEEAAVGPNAGTVSRSATEGISSPTSRMRRSRPLMSFLSPSAMRSWVRTRLCCSGPKVGQAVVWTQVRPSRVRSLPRGRESPMECSSAWMREAACVRRATKTGAVAHEGGLLALHDGLAVDLGDEVDDAHAGEQRGIEGIVLVVGLGDGTQPLGMGEHEMAARPVEQVVEPGPGGTGLDDDLQRLEGVKDAAKLADLMIADPRRLVRQRSVVAHDRDDDVRCVSVDSCDMHGGLLLVESRRFLGKNPA